MGHGQSGRWIQLSGAGQAGCGQAGSGPQEAFAAGKKAFNQAVLSNLEETLNYEGILQEEAGKSAEHHEGVAAFLGKRPPNFK